MPALPLSRRQDWPRRLADYLASVRDRPFAWGQHDCCLHAAAALAAQTDFDLAADLRGTYATARQAAALVRARYGSIWDIPPAHGLTAIEMAQAQRGHWVGCLIGRRRALGVVAGNKSAFVGPTGLIWLPTLECARAWSF